MLLIFFNCSELDNKTTSSIFSAFYMAFQRCPIQALIRNVQKVLLDFVHQEVAFDICPQVPTL
jgi:hypothetical protein